MEGEEREELLPPEAPSSSADTTTVEKDDSIPTGVESHQSEASNPLLDAPTASGGDVQAIGVVDEETEGGPQDLPYFGDTGDKEGIIESQDDATADEEDSPVQIHVRGGASSVDINITLEDDVIDVYVDQSDDDTTKSQTPSNAGSTASFPGGGGSLSATGGRSLSSQSLLSLLPPTFTRLGNSPLYRPSSEQKYPGLTMADANSLLIEAIQQVVNDFNARTKQRRRDLILDRFKKDPAAASEILCVLALLFSYFAEVAKGHTNDNLTARLIVETLLVVFAIGVATFIETRDALLAKSELPDRVLSRLQDFIQFSDELPGNLSQKTLPPFVEPFQLVRVYRDKKWIKLPATLIVSGDVVQFAAEERAPARMESLDFPGYQVNRGDKVSNVHPIPPASARKSLALSRYPERMSPQLGAEQRKQKAREEERLQRERQWRDGGGHYIATWQTFLMQETPYEIQCIEFMEASRTRPTSEMNKKIKLVWKQTQRCMVLGTLLSLIMNSVRLYLATDKNLWVELLVYRQAYLWLSLLPLSLPIVLMVFNSYGNARLEACFQAFKNPKRHRGDSASTVNRRSLSQLEDPLELSSFYDTYLMKPENEAVDPSSAKIWDIFKAVVKGGKGIRGRSPNLLHSVGSTTVLCFVDQHGTLSQPHYSVDRVFFIEGEGRPMELALSTYLNQPNKMAFEDSEFEEYISNLNPLGLSSLLNSQCGRDVELNGDCEHFGEVAHHECEPMFECLCDLTHLIGFEDDIAEGYERLQIIHTVAEMAKFSQTQSTHTYMPLQRSTSVIVRETESEDNFQLHCKGHLDVVLSKCTDIWDGATVRPLTELDVKLIYEFARQFSEAKCLEIMAFSYSPVNPAIGEVFADPGCCGVPIGVFEREGEPSEMTTPAIDAITRELLERVQSRQIFIGMVGMRRQGRKEFEYLIDHMRDAGIRFAFFSTKNNRKTKAFAEKLGLDTTWNSCISLNEYDDSHYNEHEVHLPFGIESIRKHLQEVDDIPLLVSLFTNSTAETSRDMISILQEHGEVVFCLGSPYNLLNTTISSQSDIAASLDPLIRENCRLARTRRSYDPVTLANEHEILLTSSLNSAACSTHISNDKKPQAILDVFKTGRVLLWNTEQSLLFGLSAHFTLFLVQLLGSLMFMPPLYSGIHVLWCSFVIFPMLGLSILFTPEPPGVMKLLPGKNVTRVGAGRFAKVFLVRFLPAIGTTVLVFFRCMALALPVDGESASWVDVFEYQKSKTEDLPTYLDALSFAQTTSISTLVFLLAFMSMCQQSPTLSIIHTPPWKNIPWMLLVLSIFTFQILFHILYLLPNQFNTGLSKIAPVEFLVVFLMPVAIVLLDEIVKKFDRKKHKRTQMRRKLEFETKLGMHSPVMPV